MVVAQRIRGRALGNCWSARRERFFDPRAIVTRPRSPQVRDPGGTWHHLGGQSVSRPAVREQASMLKRAFEVIMQSINPAVHGAPPTRLPRSR